MEDVRQGEQVLRGGVAFIAAGRSVSSSSDAIEVTTER